jgi:hypothetical protein
MSQYSASGCVGAQTCRCRYDKLQMKISRVVFVNLSKRPQNSQEIEEQQVRHVRRQGKINEDKAVRNPVSFPALKVLSLPAKKEKANITRRPSTISNIRPLARDVSLRNHPMPDTPDLPPSATSLANGEPMLHLSFEMSCTCIQANQDPEKPRHS